MRADTTTDSAGDGRGLQDAANNLAAGLTWQEATVPVLEPRARLGFDLDVDVCVVGAGLAGLTAATEIARHGWSVAVVEARRVASAASGRNTGFVSPGFAESLDMIVDRVGPDHARELWALSDGGVTYMRDAIAGFAPAATNGDIKLGDGWLSVSKRAASADMMTYGERLAALGARVVHWPSEKLNAVLRSPVYGGALYFSNAFHIHPLRYARALANAAEKAGVRIFEETAALSLDPAGVRKRIVTPAARVRAAHVVVAGNVGLGPLMPRLGATLIPVTTYVATTAHLREQLAQAIGFAGAVSDSRGADSHYRIVDGDRLMWAGGLTTWAGNPRHFRRRLAADIQRIFPGLQDIAFDYLWAGTMGVPVHKMPQVGQLYPGVWVASGFAGHGLNTTAMAGRLIASAITGGDDRWRLFQPYNLAWAGGLTGRVVVQSAYWAKRIKDRTDAVLAEPVPLSPLPESAATDRPGDAVINAKASRATKPGDHFLEGVAVVPRKAAPLNQEQQTVEPAAAKTKSAKSSRKKAPLRKKSAAQETEVVGEDKAEGEKSGG